MPFNEVGRIAILGVFVADTAYRAERQPRMGETILGERFALGPGGKGSNQAVAAGRLGAEVSFISKLGDDAFADLAFATWQDATVRPVVTRNPDTYTGAAYIFVDDATGDNAIIICPGAAATISPADVEAAGGVIRSAQVFVTQLEQPVEAARRGLEIARSAGVTTILNPAPAMALDDELIALCDWVTPNETEAEGLTGVAVTSVEDARQAADGLLRRGAGGAVITLGGNGALLHTPGVSVHVGAVDAGPVVETTGAGDAFNGGFAVGLARGMEPEAAVRFGAAVAGLSVTRPGTAPSMPSLVEVHDVLSK
ncbi:MAG: ribokinase [Pseudomonadota bacterium]